MYFAAIFLTVLANVLYHVSQRYIRGDVHPLLSLAITYSVALMATIVLMVCFPPPHSLATEFKKASWASYSLGGAIVLLELGFLLAYRAGWQLNTAALYSNVAVATVLIPLGYALLHESLSPRKGVGIALALVALILLSAPDSPNDIHTDTGATLSTTAD